MHRRRLSDSEAVIMNRTSRANVPFSWENKPGLSKVSAVTHDRRHDHRVLSEHLNMEYLTLKLAPPPRLSSQGGASGSSGRFVVVDRQSRLPLCSIQPSLGLNSFRLLGGTIVKKEEDPFLAAFMKCTSKTNNPIHHHVPAGNNGKNIAGKKIKTMFSFSCKYSCTVKEDSIVKMPYSPK